MDVLLLTNNVPDPTLYTAVIVFCLGLFKSIKVKRYVLTDKYIEGI